MTNILTSHKIFRDVCATQNSHEIPEGWIVRFDQGLTRFDLPLKIFKQFLKIVRKFRGASSHPRNLGKIFTEVWHKISQGGF